MDEKERLLEALKQAETKAWVAAALAAINHEKVVFAGNAGEGASSTAGELLRVYRIRQMHCQEKHIEAYGLTELIESLAACRESDVVNGQPFLGPTNSVTAFWHPFGHLMGCVTVRGRDPDGGWKNLDFALGKLS